MRIVMAVALVAALAGCGGDRCKQVSDVRASLARAAAPNRSADVRVTVPYAHANAVLAGLLAQDPVSVTLDAPDVRVLPRIRTPLTATAREVILQPGTDDHVRFASTLEIRDREHLVTELEVLIEVKPDVTANQLVVGFGPQHLISIKPKLGANAQETLRETTRRWVPDYLKRKIPEFAIDAAVRTLGKELTETSWELLRGTLMKKLGDLTKMKLRLPDVPIARHQIRSTADVMVIELETDLPVRRGLAPASALSATDVGVEISGSAAAELANWAIDHGHAPQRYSRNLKPKADGEFAPRFDFLVEDTAHPLKVYSFQERGGCSYHKVGVRAAIAVEGDHVKATALDRDLEAQNANPVIEAAAWTQYFLTGWIDRSKQAAAHTRIGFGNRTLATRVTRAAITGGVLQFSLRFDAPTNPAGPSARRSSSAPRAARDTRRAAYRTRC